MAAKPRSLHSPKAPYHAYHAYHAPFPSAALGREANPRSHRGLRRRIVEVSDQGLFHGHVEGKSSDAALEKLVALGALTAPTGGRPSTHWSAIQEDEHKKNDESAAEVKEPAEDQ
jgi:hypothetical protein